MGKIETLKKNYEFKNVLNNGKYYVENQLTIYILKNSKSKNIVGIAINTKMGKAVKRNHVKRLIRENYREIADRLKKGHNIVFIWNKKENLKNAQFYIIREDMERAFKKAKLFS